MAFARSRQCLEEHDEHALINVQVDSLTRRCVVARRRSITTGIGVEVLEMVTCGDERRMSSKGQADRQTRHRRTVLRREGLPESRDKSQTRDTSSRESSARRSEQDASLRRQNQVESLLDQTIVMAATVLREVPSEVGQRAEVAFAFETDTRA